MSGSRLRGATSALLLLGLLATLAVLPAHVSVGPSERTVAAHVAAIRGDDGAIVAARTTPARRLADVTLTAAALDVTPALMPFDVRRDSVVRAAGRQFDTWVAQRGPPSS